MPWRVHVRSHFSNEKQLQVLYFNARSLTPKLNELRVLCDLRKPDIVCITESWLREDIGLSECSIHGYHCVRCDRHRHGGAEADIDKAWELWLRTFLSIMNECIPKKTITQKCTLPWMNKFIQTKIKKRNSTYKRANQTRVFDGYKKLRNEVVNLLRISKRLFEEVTFGRK